MQQKQTPIEERASRLRSPRGSRCPITHFMNGCCQGKLATIRRFFSPQCACDGVTCARGEKNRLKLDSICHKIRYRTIGSGDPRVTGNAELATRQPQDSPGQREDLRGNGETCFVFSSLPRGANETPREDTGRRSRCLGSEKENFQCAPKGELTPTGKLPTSERPELKGRTSAGALPLGRRVGAWRDGVTKKPPG